MNLIVAAAPESSTDSLDPDFRRAGIEVIYGGRPLLLDERALLRNVLGPLMARARGADFAVARFRLGAIDLHGGELAGLQRCRLLIERLQAVSDGDALAANRDEVRARLALMSAFLESGRVEVRAAGGRCWTPDFSLLSDISRADGAPPVRVGVLGAHFFARPYPVTGPALTQVTADPDVTALIAERFEELWQGGYDIAFVIADRLRRLLEPRRSVPALPALVREAAPPRPPEVAASALQARFGPPGERHSSGILDLAAFQADAVARAETALVRWRGVVLADGVGLGKTYMALALIEAEIREGGCVLVAAPASLRKEWLEPLRRLGAGYGVRPVVGREPRGAAGTPSRLYWISHGLLSREAPVPRRPPTLVVVDEAHAFRNPATRRYRALAALCRGARVVELTATPFNNLLSDLYFQLRLFAGDAAFRTVGVLDLRQAFGAAEATGEVRPILPVLREVVVRRTRPFLRDHYGAIALPDGRRERSLPRRAPPEPVRYTLSPSIPGGLSGLVEAIAGLKLAPYRLESYRAADAEPGKAVRVTPGMRLEAVGELRRCGLLKRLESSTAAFRSSVRSLLSFLESFVAELEAGRVLRPRDRTLLEGEQLLLGGLALAPVPPWLDRSRVLVDARADAATLRRLLRSLPEDADDRKRERLRELVASLGEKVVIFTEFRETAREIARALSSYRVGLVHGGGAWMGRSPVGRRELIERFAPDANGARQPAPHERVDVLVATDVLAEGLNLQDAPCVVSYDLPWNPVRLMQRIGRVDRLGSRHAEVRPFHFVPESGLEEMLGLMKRLRRKVRLIRRALPGEPEVLDGDGVDPLLRRIIGGDGAALELVERAESAPFEIEDRLHRLWTSVRQESGGRGRTAPAAPSAAMTVSIHANGVDPGSVLLCFEGGGHAWLVWRTGEIPRDDDATAGAILAAALAATDGRPVNRTVLAAAEAACRRALQQRAGPAGPTGLAATAIRRVLADVAGDRHRPDPGRCARADMLLARLHAGLTAGEHIGVRQVLRGSVGPDADLLTALEQALRDPSPTPAPQEPDPWGLCWRLVAAIHVRAAAEPGELLIPAEGDLADPTQIEVDDSPGAQPQIVDGAEAEVRQLVAESARDPNPHG